MVHFFLKQDHFSCFTVQTMSVTFQPATGLIDYDKLEEVARVFRPKIIIAGVSAYSRLLDYGRFRKVLL